MSLKTASRTVASLAVGASLLIVAACANVDAESFVDTPPSTSVAPATSEPPPVATISTSPDRDDLGDLLSQLIVETGLPAVGVTAFTSDRIIEAGVAGVRRSGDPTLVELDDRFSIGSNAKAMTATLVATFVDDSLIDWDTTVADVYELPLPGMDPSWAAVTIRHLLNHTSGLDDEVIIPMLTNLDTAAPLVGQRLVVVDAVTAEALAKPPGDFVYSSVGYVLAGAMLEELTGTPWEDLMQTRVFDVIGMDSCGFYAPGTPGAVDEPWGHYDEQGGAAIDPGDPDADFPHVIAAAGMVHCNMADWVRFLQSQMRGLQGSATEIVSREAFDALQTTPGGSDYALGWLALRDPNGATTFYHHGSNHRFTAEVWLEPGEDWGLITVTNIGETIADPLLAAVDHAMFNRRNS